MNQWVESFNNTFSWFAGMTVAIISEGIFNGVRYTGLLLSLMLADIIIGILSAVISQKSRKSREGGLSSRVMFIGVMKKIMTLVMVAVSCRLDLYLDLNYIGNAVTIAFSVQELISIIENYAKIGTVPEVLKKVLDIMKGKGEENGD